MSDEKSGDVKFFGVPIGKGLASIFAVIGLILLTWLAKSIWDRTNQTSESLSELKSKIERLEGDEAKWAAMASMQKDLVDLNVKLEVMRRVWEYEYGREIPAGEPRPEHEKLLKIPEEEIRKAIEDKFREADRYKMMEQAMRSKK